MNYNFSDIFNSLSHLVGWEASKNPNLPNGYSINPIPTNNWFDNPISSQYYNGIHPLVTIFNIYNSVNSSPNSLTDIEFTDILLDFNKKALQSVLSKLAIKKKIARETKQLLERGNIYKGFANMNSVETNNGRFVGWCIELGSSLDYALTVHNLAFQFNNSFVGLPIYLYHTSKKEAITSFTLDYTSNFNIEVKDLDSTWKLRNSNATYGDLGYYFIGYYQNDLQARNTQAYNRTTMNFSLENVCYSCGDRWSYERFVSYTKHFRIIAISFASQYLNGVELPTLGDNMSNITKETNKTFGMNANVSIVSDITDFIIKYSDLLVIPLQYEMVSQVLNHLAYQSRINSHSSDTTEMARAILHFKDDPIHKLISQSLDAYDYDMSGQNSPSMPNKQLSIKRFTL